jgi:uncharacterized SAM-dependent methyltransferase
LADNVIIITFSVKPVPAVILQKLIIGTRILTECSAKNRHPREEHTWLEDAGIHEVNTMTVRPRIDSVCVFDWKSEENSS